VPNLRVSNHNFANVTQETELAKILRDACLAWSAANPAYGGWTPKDVAIDYGIWNFLPEDGAPVQIVVDVLYAGQGRTPDTVRAFCKALGTAAQSFAPLKGAAIEVTCKALVNPDCVVSLPQVTTTTEPATVESATTETEVP